MPSPRFRLNQKALSRSPKFDQVGRKVSRRDLFSGGAAVVASMSPGVQSAVSAISDDSVKIALEEVGKTSKLTVSTSIGNTWVLDTSTFAGTPILVQEKGTNSTIIRLTGARFQGTQIALNLEATIPHFSSGKISFSFYDCGDGSASFKLSAPLNQWIKGNKQASGAIDKQNLNHLISNLFGDTSATAIEKGSVIYSVSGELAVVASMDLEFSEQIWPIADLSIQAKRRSEDTMVSGKDRTLTKIQVTKRDSWTGHVALKANSGWQVNGSTDGFDTWEAECHESGQVATRLTGSGELNVELPGTAKFKATNPTLSSLGINGEDIHFASYLQDEGDWIHHEGVSLHAVPSTSEPFILSTNIVGDLVGQPVLHSKNIAVAIEDAFVTFGSSKLPNLTLANEPQDRPPVTTRPPVTQRPPVIQRPPVGQRPPVTKPPVVQNPPIVKVDPNIKVSSQVWIPSIEIVRPQDFLNLKFEFVNWRMVSSIGVAPYFEREINTRPAYVIVEFPPQAVGEQTFGMTSPVQTTPVQTLLSGPTRLVFFIPIAQKTIKFSLTDDEGLLDWDNWSLSVAPAAFSTFSGKVKVDRSWQHPIQDIKIGASRDFELLAERSPSVPERLASIFRIQRGTEGDQLNRADLQIPIIRQKPPNIIHFKPQVREVNPQLDPTKIVPAIPTGRTGPVFRYYTNIEIPAMLQMSPDEEAHFVHARTSEAPTGRSLTNISPVRAVATKRTPIWHTRLGAFATLNGKSVPVEASDDGEWFYTQDAEGRLGPFKSATPVHPHLRAVDSTDYDVNVPNTADFSITKKQRKDLVDTMSMRSASSGTDAPPFIADRLMLTSLGGFLKGSWTWGDSPPPHDVVGWRHWSTLGREHYVYIREAGFLFPTGHRVDKITITERKFRPSGKGVVARLEKRMYLVLMNPVVNLNASEARNMAFSQIVCKTKTTPDLDFTGMLKVAGTDKFFEFSMVGTDMDGNQVSWTQQAMFYVFSAGINTSTNWSVGNEVNLRTGGHMVTFAPTQSPSDATNFPCQTIYMGGSPGTPNPNKGIPAFRPIMNLAAIKIPAIEQYLPSGSNLGFVPVKFADGYKANGFTGGAEVFFALKSPVSTPQGDGKKFGGMVNASIKMDVISRKHGPMPNPTGNSISPTQYASIDSEEYASIDANFVAPDPPKLLGVVSIWDLLPDSIDVGGNGADVPKFKVAKVFANDKFGVVGSGNSSAPLIGAVASFSWQPTLKEWSPATWPFSQKCFTKYKGTSQLRVNAAYYQITDPEGSSFPVGSSYSLKAGIYNFQVNACDQVHVMVDKIEFSSQTGSNSSIRIDIDDIQFLGMLSFVGVLQSILSPGTKGYHFQSSSPNSELLASTNPEPYGVGIEPILDINGQGLTVGFSVTVPTIGIGVVTVMNISVLSELILPWFGDALTFHFAFCKRDAPFAVSVYGIAGGGFLGIEVTPGGIKSIEGAIEFGAMVALNFGVASGSISLMAGFYFKYEVNGGTTLTGYVRLVGEVDVLGIISASLTMYLGLTYNTASKVLSGDASVSIRISLFCFHKTVTVHAHKEFAGSSSDASIGTLWAGNSPPALFTDHQRTQFTKSVTSQQFKNYCSAFGGNA